MDTALIVSIAMVISVFLAGMAYSVPRLYWYRAQTKLLEKHAAGEQKLLDIHIADRTTDVPEITIGNDLSKQNTWDEAGPYS